MKVNKRRFARARRDRLLMDEMVRDGAIEKVIERQTVYFKRCFSDHYPRWFAFTAGRRGLLVAIADARLFVRCKRYARVYLTQLQGNAADATDV